MCKVSVVIITYAQEAYIRQAIDSVLMQEAYFDYEIIVGEDNSPDNTRDILLEYKEKYPEKFTLILRDRNVGATQNLYDAFIRCKGKYIAILEGDDYWIDSNKLQIQKEFLDKNSEFIAVSHVIEGRDAKANIIGEYPDKNLRNRQIYMNHFLNGRTFGVNSLMFRNIFNYAEEDYNVIKANRMVGDLTLCMILLDKGKIFILDKTMGVYRIRNDNKNTNYNSINDWSKKYCDATEVINANIAHFNNKYDLFYFYFQFSAIALLWSIRRKEFKKFIEIFKTGPANFRRRFYFYLPLGLPKIIYKKFLRILKAK